ncbi:MAG: type II toxin-antitoxin system Phd/YefM family antitoxin, partial [Candidatus Sulfotelmatobacter sp.]
LPAAAFAQFCRLDEYMKTITVTAARKRFGALLDAVQHEPVLIRRKNCDAWVVISAEEYGRIHGLKSANPKRAQVDPKTDGS